MESVAVVRAFEIQGWRVNPQMFFE